MKEIGGYIELDTYRGPMLHEGAVALNCGRNALAYLFKTKGIKTLWIPKFICDSVSGVCAREGVEVKYYSVGVNLRPAEDVHLKAGEWFYLVNYYGQIGNDEIYSYVHRYDSVIVDQAQSYYQMPIDGVDTLYTCRKFFGVADGAFLYTDQKLEDLPIDETHDRMGFLLGRYERSASEFYADYVANNHLFGDEPIKQMSKLTANLLRGIDYEYVKRRRTENYTFLHEKLGKLNKLNLSIPEGSFMYPLYIDNGSEIRKKFQTKKIYIPTLWPDVFELCKEDETEYDMAANILPLPIDQRYGKEEMQYMIEELTECLKR